MLIADIETVARGGIKTEPVSAPAHYKDETKIAAYVSEKTADQVLRAALYPWTAQVIAIGWCHAGGAVAESRIANSEAGEVTLLTDFWREVADGSGRILPIVGFNHRGFDLPVLIARSMLLGVRHPEINLDRYRSPHPDLMQILTFNGLFQSRSLRWFAETFGLNTDDAFSGALIAQLHADGDWESIRKHVESDVTLTRQLAERIGLIKAPVRAVA
jgi:hypothetical protein